MEKKFIQRSDLGEIMEDLAEQALQNVDQFQTEVLISKYGKTVGMSVNIRSNTTFNTLAHAEFEVIERLEDSDDILDYTIHSAIGKDQEPEEQTPSNN